MAYRTGRTRTLTYITTIAADADYWLCNTNPPVDDDPHPSVDGTLHLACSWASANFTPSGRTGYITDPHPAGDVTTTGYLDMALTCMGDTQSYHLAVRSVTIPRGSCDHTPVHMSGTVTIKCDVEEWVDFPIVDWTEAQKGQPKIDPPPYTGLRLTERPRPGGTASIVVSLADGSGSITHTITTSDGASGIGYPFLTGLSIVTGDASATWTANTTWQGIALTAPYTVTSTSAEASCVSGNRVTSNGGLATITVALSSSIAPAKAYTLTGLLLSMYDDYPVDLKGLVTDHQDASGSPVTTLFDIPAGGSYATNYSQKQYSAQANLNGTLDAGITLDEWYDVLHKLQIASLMTAGEDTDNDRLMFRCYLWDALSFSQASSTPLDSTLSAANWTAQDSHSHVTGSSPLVLSVDTPPSGSSWTGGAHSPLNASGVRGGTDVLKGTSWTGVDLSGYALLKVDLSQVSGDPSPYTVTIGGKAWTKDKTGADLMTGSTAQYLDLDNPTNNTASTDATDTQWQWQGASAGPYSCAADGWGWGVHSLSDFKLSGLQPGTDADTPKAYHLNALALVWQDHSRLSAVPSYKSWVQAYAEVHNDSETTTYTYYRRALQGDTDGQQSYEWTDQVWIQVVGGSSGITTNTYTPVAIKTIVDLMHTGQSGAFPRKGFDATDLKPNPADGNNLLKYNYLNSDLPSTYLCGGGLWTDSTAWHHGFDNASGGTLKGQIIADQISWYPECGDAFFSGGYGGALKLYGGALLRGNFWGTVIDSDHSPSAAEVKVVEHGTGGTLGADGAAQAVATTFGEYWHEPARAYAGTGTPYPKGNKTYDCAALLGSTPYPTVTSAIQARRRQRACFTVPVLGAKQPSYDVGVAGRHVRAYVLSSTIRVGTAGGPVPTDWMDVDSSLMETWPCVKWEKRASRPRLWLLSIGSASGSGPVKLRYSNDEGATWNMVTLDATGTEDTLVETEHGLKYVYYRQSDGSIKGQILDAQNNVVKTEFTAIASGVDDTGIDADDFQVGGGEWRVGLLYMSAGVPTYKSAQDGITFS